MIDIDPKEKKGYRITIKVEDEGGNSDTFDVNITMYDINDNAPVFYKVISYNTLHNTALHYTTLRCVAVLCNTM